MMDWIVIYRAHWDYLTSEKASSMEEYFSHELPGTSAQELADTVKALTETWGDDLRSKPPMAKDIVKAARSRRQRGTRMADQSVQTVKAELAKATPERRWEILCGLPTRMYLDLVEWVRKLPGGERRPASVEKQLSEMRSISDGWKA